MVVKLMKFVYNTLFREVCEPDFDLTEVLLAFALTEELLCAAGTISVVAKPSFVAVVDVTFDKENQVEMHVTLEQNP